MKKLRTLLLNANFQPRAVIPVERAFSLLFEEDLAEGIGKVDVILSASDVLTDEIPDEMKFWRTPSTSFPVPLVVALRKMCSPLFDMTSSPLGTPNLESLIKRDGNRCLYCLRTARELGLENPLTIDHIVPKWRFKSMREAHVWGNVAAACFECNNRKGGRTPEEAGMTLHGVPLEPTKWDLASHDLLDCQRAFVRWCREGGPIPDGFVVAA